MQNYALRVRARGRAVVAEAGVGLAEVHAVDVAGAGVALEAVGIRAHLLAFAGELPLGLETEALALGLAGLLGARPGVVDSRERGALRGVLVAIDAEAQGDAGLGEALALGVLGAPEVLVGAGRVHPLEAVLFHLGAVATLDQDHVGRTGAARGRHRPLGYGRRQRVAPGRRLVAHPRRLSRWGVGVDARFGRATVRSLHAQRAAPDRKAQDQHRSSQRGLHGDLPGRTLIHGFNHVHSNMQNNGGKWRSALRTTTAAPYLWRGSSVPPVSDDVFPGSSPRAAKSASATG